MASSPSLEPLQSLYCLPPELLHIVFTQLPNRDVKNLRLTSRFMRDIARLRLQRVFISANQRDIQVLRAIADDETFRSQVTELVWDDSRWTDLPEPRRLGGFGSLGSSGQSPPRWFTMARDDNVFEIKSRRGFDVDRPDHAAREKQLAAQMPPLESWQYYQALLRQQRQVLASGADAEALRYALERFPSLKRITLTPAAHGFLFTPLYDTPLIRSLPYGFNYPQPRGWPFAGDQDQAPRAPQWDDSEQIKNQWRGFRIITQVLAQMESRHRITDLILDVSLLNTGLNCHVFDKPCDEYHDLVSTLRRPGFRRLDLSLLVGGLERQEWVSYRSGYLRRALAEATDLEHISLHTNVEQDPDGSAAQVEGSIKHFNSLHSIFPIERWSRLQHFGLSGFLVTQDDVVSFLSALPATVRSVELSFLHFVEHRGHYRGLLADMRDKLGWRERDAQDRPRITIGVALDTKRSGRAVWVSEEAEAFVYGRGPNPFGGEDGSFPYQVQRGFAGVERDEFEPAHERPYTQPKVLRQLGIFGSGS
ncbi:hypothetical protein FZEAL_4142 [Fusarium zealandicum]|uniref:F-box domain-containing protein n=1 Tax=Fusarium zealandicum TaxID=1053134 RepID=A0A8H4UN57_9HYPO|nr:hypothetical protein FZEAL_4142 [Fusarium zealandicum]